MGTGTCAILQHSLKWLKVERPRTLAQVHVPFQKPQLKSMAHGVYPRIAINNAICLVPTQSEQRVYRQEGIKCDLPWEKGLYFSHTCIYIRLSQLRALLSEQVTNRWISLPVQESFKKSVELLQEEDEIPLVSITGKRGTLTNGGRASSMGKATMRRETVSHWTLFDCVRVFFASQLL